ncbi:MAG TPA: MFS transporter [Streptomyces sp.]|uniref:MFS transporter n=1 Tax=Streptomyces sp. TaxID=1931 RepID=UPI002BCEC36E|nr:MFS transporter [Streptomyces sp.]HWU09618.1 MFS transporter [Streptomyces sp.]
MTTAPTVITPPVSPAVRAARSAVWTLLASSLLIKAAGFAWDFLGYYVADGLGYGTTAAGAALTAFGLGWCAGLASAGALTDRLGQRAGLSLVMALSSLACFALAIAESFPALLLVSFFLGMTMEIHRPAVSAQINATIDSEAGRTRAQSWLYWASNVGIAICAAAGGYLAHHYSYKALFVVNGLACLAFAAVAYRVLTPRPATGSAEAPAVTYRQVFADPSLRWIAVAAVCGMTCAWGLVSVLPLLMTDDGLPPTSYGLAMLANTITVLALTPPLTRLLVGSGDTPKYPLVPILACGCAILGLGISLAALQHTTLGYAAAAALLVPGEIAFSVALGAYISTHAPRNATGRYQAVLSGATAVASLPPLGIALALNTGGRPLVAALLVGSALIAVAACRPLAKALRDAPQTQTHPLPTPAP